MQRLQKSARARLNRLFITWFGCGEVPLAPGTMGSIGALPLCWLFSEHAPLWFRISFATGMTCLAIFGSAEDQKQTSNKDPSYVVVDEVAGMLWACLLTPAAWMPMLFSFALFRFFDVVKVFPANYFDGRSKVDRSAFRRGVWIVLDDVVAGLYATLIFQGWILYGQNYF